MNKPSLKFGMLILLAVSFCIGTTTELATAQGEETFQEKLDGLIKEFDPQVEDWTAAYRKASRTERTELLKNKPSEIFGSKLMELYEAHADETGSQAALEKAISLGSMKIKTKAAEQMFELASTQDPEVAEQTYRMIARRGWGKIKTKTIQVLFENAKAATDDKVALRNLEHLLTTKGRAEADIATEAGMFFWNRIEDDLKSENAADTLILLGQYCEGDIREKAFDALLQHHPDSDQLSIFLENVPRTPSAVTEQVLEALCKHKDDLKRWRAGVELSKYYRIRETHKGYYSSDKEEAIEKIGQEMYDYLTRPTDPQEIEDLKKVLRGAILSSVSYGDNGLMNDVREQLYVVNNFSIGSKAIEIVGKDLHGEAFRLSDYKGKVVFLDFWGDW